MSSGNAYMKKQPDRAERSQGHGQGYIYQEKLDGHLREIWKEKTLSFYERYPDLKRMKYDKAKKGWV